MKLGIMQPYFFPYLGYFQLIDSVDYFVFFDTPQYERRGWMNRNRILNPQGDFTYITVPIVKAPQSTAINKIHVDETQQWRDKILSQLQIYKKRANYYEQVIALIKQVFVMPYENIAELNIHSIISVCEYLNIPFEYDVFSKMNLNIPEICEPDEWALHITEELHYDEYINAPGGQTFFNKNKYTEKNIQLHFIEPELSPYVQKIGHFVPGLSIIDVMMFNSPEKIVQMLKEYTIV